MTYIDGFVIPVPNDRKQDYLKMAEFVAPIFKEHGAIEVVETWGDDLSKGKVTDFFMAVKAEDNENVVFSWIVWPDKETRDAGNAKVIADERFDQFGENDVFNGKRMFWGGFSPILEEGEKTSAGYVEGFLVPVPEDKKDAYLKQAKGGAPIFRDLGCTRLVECWADDVPHGEVTDFYRAVKARDDETVVFSWMEYPSKEARDNANAKMMEDPRFAELGEMPFDGKRMIYSGFAPILQA